MVVCVEEWRGVGACVRKWISPLDRSFVLFICWFVDRQNRSMGSATARWIDFTTAAGTHRLGDAELVEAQRRHRGGGRGKRRPVDACMCMCVHVLGSEVGSTQIRARDEGAPLLEPPPTGFDMRRPEAPRRSQPTHPGSLIGPNRSRYGRRRRRSHPPGTCEASVRTHHMAPSHLRSLSPMPKRGASRLHATILTRAAQDKARRGAVVHTWSGPQSRRRPHGACRGPGRKATWLLLAVRA